MSGSPNGVKFKRKLNANNQHEFNNFCNLSRLILRKVILTYVKLTVVLHYRIHAFLHTELLVRNSFQSEAFRLRAAMKTRRFANI